MQREAVPAALSTDGKAEIHVVAGMFGATRGPIRSLTHTFMSLVRLRAGGRVEFEGITGRVVLAYVIRGGIEINGRRLSQFELAKLSDDGHTLSFEGRPDATVLIAHAARIDEPVAMRGPFVMNTRTELAQAFQDFQHSWFEVSNRSGTTPSAASDRKQLRQDDDGSYS